jgi:hypothetical protein
MGKRSRGSHEEQLLELVSFVEDILFVRWQTLDNDPDHNVERLAMEAIADDLLLLRFTNSDGRTHFDEVEQVLINVPLGKVWVLSNGSFPNPKVFNLEQVQRRESQYDWQPS